MSAFILHDSKDSPVLLSLEQGLDHGCHLRKSCNNDTGYHSGSLAFTFLLHPLV